LEYKEGMSKEETSLRSRVADLERRELRKEKEEEEKELRDRNS
jgi:hypothetical protein